jgi:hypothetical protein
MRTRNGPRWRLDAAVRIRCSCFAARRPLALGMADLLMRFDLGPPMRAPRFWMPRLPWFTPKWRFSRVQSDSALLPFTHPAGVGNRRLGRWHSEPPGFARSGWMLFGQDARPRASSIWREFGHRSVPRVRICCAATSKGATFFAATTSKGATFFAPTKRSSATC